jgi:hypothetical protein
MRDDAIAYCNVGDMAMEYVCVMVLSRIVASVTRPWISGIVIHGSK